MGDGESRIRDREAEVARADADLAEMITRRDQLQNERKELWRADSEAGNKRAALKVELDQCMRQMNQVSTQTDAPGSFKLLFRAEVEIICGGVCLGGGGGGWSLSSLLGVVPDHQIWPNNGWPYVWLIKSSLCISRLAHADLRRVPTSYSRSARRCSSKTQEDLV